MTIAEPIHVLVVDDSAVARMALEECLGALPGFRVSLAGDGFVAQARIAIDPPDVVLLDLELPRMHGLELLAWLHTHHPVPVVICSESARSSDVVQRALHAGAVDSIAKPALAVGAAAQLGAMIRSAHRAHAGAARAPSRATPTATATPRPFARVASHAVIAIGASTGGTEALATLLPQLPRRLPGIVIVQHMPAGFTRQFAERLDRTCKLTVREAETGAVLEAGVAFVAPGDRHTRIAARRGRYVIEVFDGPIVTQHRPSVNVLFHSVAEAAGASAVGVILTGMGADGVDGMLAMRRAGARTLAQDRASSVVYGMPRAAAERGAADAIVPIHDLAGALVGAVDELPRAR